MPATPHSEKPFVQALEAWDAWEAAHPEGLPRALAAPAPVPLGVRRVEAAMATLRRLARRARSAGAPTPPAARGAALAERLSPRGRA